MVTFPSVIVARATPGTLPHFPDAVRLADGRVLCAYRESTGHVRADGRVMLVESADDGATWSKPRVAVDGEHDDRDPKLVQLSDGTVLLSYFVLEWKAEAGRPFRVWGTYVVRSADGGRTWSAPVLVGGDQMRWAVSHGAPVELPGGDLLLPVYGTDPERLLDPAAEVHVRDALKLERAVVVRSLDGGRTWPAETAAVVASGHAFHFQEPTLTVLPDGGIVALIRTTAKHAYLSRSADRGHTWSPPAETDLPASSHHVLTLGDGGVLVAYGDTSRRFSPRRNTVARVVPRPAETWNGWPDIELYDSGHYDQANPSSVEIAPGRFLTIGFDVPHGTVVGVFSSRDDYPSS
ncbi:exo-alpha-sialidase [Hamadaea tsunoensis]|uniref:exo-alpha-sialidase n=1 Tax=Hamadaea tsunoensis TaxID=53368 RepID=UPI00047FF53D|nr:sialidase family protein [Hamadaea tsunoensis]